MLCQYVYTKTPFKKEFLFCYAFWHGNFPVFDIKHIQLLLDPFALGMTTHIIPIKYEALTPDGFLLFFRSAGKTAITVTLCCLRQTSKVQSKVRVAQLKSGIAVRLLDSCH